MKNFDYTFGARLHGNIASIIGGTPSMLIVIDSRTRELADYHKLYCCNEKDLINNDIESLIRKSDYSGMIKQHKHNFDRFIKFLNLNDLPNIYQEDYNRKQGIIDEVIKESNLYPPVTPIDFSDVDSVNERMVKFSNELNEKMERLKNMGR
ncbi:MAG: hypothetical protein ACI4JB_08170 [Porcipelethomonas sp.]